MCKVKFFIPIGLVLILLVLAVSGIVVSAKGRAYGYMRWNDNDDRR